MAELILDTCALLWLASDAPQLKPAARSAIAAAPAVGVLAISAWEIALKVQQGRLGLPLAPDLWFRRVCEHHGLSEIPLTSEIAIAAAALPPLHRDPCDRFLIAAARQRGATIVSGDEMLARYGVAVIG